MNIFFLHRIARLCARYHCNKHVVRMIVETAQLLCSVWHTMDKEKAEKFQTEGKIYKFSQKNHPCAIWARQSEENYRWLCNLGLELCKEYTARYERTHKTEAIIKFWALNVPTEFESEGWSQPAQVMPEEYRDNDPVTAYRKYYKGEKAGFAVWPKGKKPKWFNQGIISKVKNQYYAPQSEQIMEWEMNRNWVPDFYVISYDLEPRY